jgi:RNA polymerase sigma-70 factor, ECF subfamily
MIARVWTGPVATDWPVRGAPAGSGAASSGDWSLADDLSLVRACLDGDRSAFDPIVERHRRRVYQVCFRFAGNHADASDLAQETFIRAFRGLHGYKGHASLATWLYRIAVNVCLNKAAVRAPQRAALEPREAIDRSTEQPDAALLRDERAAAVRAAIAQLPKKQRATLILRVYHELRHEEIAAILGSSVGTVKANFFHALANLKKLLR